MASPEKVLCISDLHLSAEHPEIANAFSAFLQNIAVEADALFILGDFFNVWIGDDDPDPFSAEVKTQLKTLSCSGVAVFIMHGNRDFLLGETFCSLSGATLINEPYTLQVGSPNTCSCMGMRSVLVIPITWPFAPWSEIPIGRLTSWLNH